MSDPAGFSPEQAKIALAEASLFARNNRYREALELVHKIVHSFQPNNVEAHLLAAKIFFELKNGLQLKKIIQHLLTFEKPTPEILLYKGRAELILKEYTACEQTLDLIEAEHRDFLDAAILRAELYIHINQNKEAIAILKAIFARRPDHEIRVMMAMAYYQEQKYSEAMTLSHRLLGMGYKNPRLDAIYKLSYQRRLEEYRKKHNISFLARPMKWIKTVFFDPDLEKNLQIESFRETEIGELEESRMEMEKETRVDFLTGAGNLKAAQINIPAHYVRRTKNLYVCFCDIDYFKAFNDCYSHRVGDQVIMAVAQEGLSFFGKEHFFRVGGDEFIWDFDGDDRTVLEKANEFREKIEAQGVALVDRLLKEKNIKNPATEHLFHLDFPITLSQGLGLWGEDGTTLDQVKSAADAGLYKIKEAGRNAVATKTEVLKQGAKPFNYNKGLIEVLNEVSAEKGTPNWFLYSSRITSKEKEGLYKKAVALFREREAGLHKPTEIR